MKKIATILSLLLVFAGFSTSAQTTTPCNAEFNFVYQNGNTLLFTPVFIGSPSNTMHYWWFGDGGVSNAVTPVHTYLSGNVFTVKHLIILTNPNGVEICRDSAFKVIQVQNTLCNLIASFYSYHDTTVANNLTWHFENTSTPVSNIDSVRWTFGDGTSSNVYSPNHTYANPGTYTVCLRIQKITPPGTAPCVREYCQTIVVPAPTACNLVVNFTITPISVANSFLFTNTTVPLNNTDSIYWSFGDGSSSNQVSPYHTYTQPGVYTVCLTVIQRSPNGTPTNCIRYKCQTITIPNTNTCTLVANFTSTLVPNTPNTFYFQNTSVPMQPSDSIRWNFGDGSTSNVSNPTHTYAQPGTYNVCLRVQQRNPNGVLTNCIREICHTVIVQTTTTCNLVANFYAYRDSSVANNLTWNFQNTSTPANGIDSVRWTFGDGTSSNVYSPTHTYTSPGVYNVCLRIQKFTAAGTAPCVREICHTITIPSTNACTLVANFTSTLIQTAPYTFQFQNTSVPLNATDSIRWTFGDGTSSNMMNPVHTYAQPGTYNVCLRVQQRTPNGGLTNCIREKCYNVYVQGPNTCNLVANFTSTYLGQNTFHFVNTSSPVTSTDSIRWTFGDGTSSNQFSPTHTYAQPGTYTVCLRIQRFTSAGTAPCVREICRNVYVPGINPTICNLYVNFYSYRDTLSASPLPFNYRFVNTSAPLNNTDSIRWSFGDGTTSNEVSPSHAYAQPGVYNVCLRIQKRNANGTLSNCIRQICRAVYVGQVLSPSNCSLQVYPNPATNYVNVNVTLQQPQMIDIYIYNSLNMLVIEKHQPGFPGNNTVNIPVSNLIPGLYRMRVVRGNSVCYSHFLKL